MEAVESTVGIRDAALAAWLPTSCSECTCCGAAGTAPRTGSGVEALEAALVAQLLPANAKAPHCCAAAAAPRGPADAAAAAPPSTLGRPFPGQ
eukprot:CAMPEP_0179082418 /NCGR_PEP_ID=MMETSP0796-20121207/37161_1 /TAXON_ID=73915 /ORGANISM="Pyrodinium bahamense, Strain pbaha01" /LENGTH=92 /DNA_ID=CAMNT_0020779811 /DNA_START=80 /DNA_END=358 /DNA_ORIENTATION=-